MISFSYPKRPDRLEPAQPPNLVGPVVLSGGVKRSGREVKHSLRSSAEATDEWSCTASSPVCLHGGDKESLTDQPTRIPYRSCPPATELQTAQLCVFL